MSNAIDMAKWMNFHLSKGKNQQGIQVMDAEALESTHTPRNHIAKPSLSNYFSQPTVPVSTTESNYASGWKNGVYRGIYV